ncbi:hypothetical protein [Flagellimonas sp.]|uniref:hypothetical protein n=1 Tax=Flagellimonas sp. TaxID=2058762 RepID=UPI003AB43D1A
MKKVLVPILLFVACSWFSSCDLDDDSPNFYFAALNAVEADVPESFELGKTYDIEVTYERPNGCTFFEGFDVTKTDQTDRDVVVIGSVLTDEENACPQEATEVVATLKFHVIYTGEYHFRFYAGEDENEEPIYLEYTVPVDPEPTN